MRQKLCAQVPVTFTGGLLHHREQRVRETIKEMKLNGGKKRVVGDQIEPTSGCGKLPQSLIGLCVSFDDDPGWGGGGGGGGGGGMSATRGSASLAETVIDLVY